MTIKNWASERAYFAHEALQNTYIVHVLAAIQATEGEVLHDNLTEIAFNLLSEWRDILPLARHLLDTCAQEMSPSILFSKHPLSRLDVDEKEILATIAHKLWLKRNRINERLAQVETCLEVTNCVIESLVMLIEGLEYFKATECIEKCLKYSHCPLIDVITNIGTSDLIGSYKVIFKLIYTTCRELSSSISNLPKSVSV